MAACSNSPLSSYPEHQLSLQIALGLPRKPLLLLSELLLSLCFICSLCALCFVFRSSSCLSHSFYLSVLYKFVLYDQNDHSGDVSALFLSIGADQSWPSSRFLSLKQLYPSAYSLRVTDILLQSRSWELLHLLQMLLLTYMNQADFPGDVPLYPPP